MPRGKLEGGVTREYLSRGPSAEEVFEPKEGKLSLFGLEDVARGEARPPSRRKEREKPRLWENPSIYTGGYLRR